MTLREAYKHYLKVQEEKRRKPMTLRQYVTRKWQTKNRRKPV